MSAELKTPPPLSPRLDDDAFRIGYRYVRNGDDFDMVGLTEEDFLHPLEEDRFMLVDKHSATVAYLRNVLDEVAATEPGLRVLADHRIDWQVEGIRPHGPDLVMFRSFPGDWDTMRGTFLVKDEKAVPLLVIEVTSRETRHVDFGRKYRQLEQVGIPYYLIADIAGSDDDPKLVAFRRTRRGFRPVLEDPTLGIFIPEIDLWFRWSNDRVVAADVDGNDLPGFVELAQLLRRTEFQLDDEKQRADSEQQRADSEQLKATAAEQRASSAEQRADDLMRELAELKVRLTQSKTESGS